MIEHRWFSSGAYTLLGHLHRPEQITGPGVLLAPPAGWEDVCSYRPLRELAELLAANGMPVLRYDLPGTGDSSGGAYDADLLEAWIASVPVAADELRQATGVSRVSVLGIRMGALLALAAAARGANVHDMVLWGGVALGRTLLREFRAFRNLEVPEYAEPQPVPSTEGDLEVGGFVLAQATVDAIEALDLTSLPAMPRRVLVLTRDDFPNDKKLTAALTAAGALLEQLPGAGFADLMAVPHEASLSGETAQMIRDWLLAESVAEFVTPESSVAVSSNEAVVLLPQSTGHSFGIISPGGPSRDWILFLNPGAGRHIGPNRLWVDMARHWAARGVPSLRLDLAGIGESDGDQNLDVAGLYDDALVSQVESAMQFLSQHHGARSFVAIGLCSGAFWAFHAAARNAAIRGAILLNPRLFFWDPEVDRRREKLRNVNAVSKPGAWKRLVRGEVPAERLRSAVRDVLDSITVGDTRPAAAPQIPAEALAETLARIRQHQSRLTMIFTEGEPLLREMEEEGFLAPEFGLRCLRIANAGHTFRPRWAQDKLREIIGAEIESVLAGMAQAESSNR